MEYYCETLFCTRKVKTDGDTCQHCEELYNIELKKDLKP